MINSFSGEYRWLSNFYPCQIDYEGIRYPSTEHAYQASKTLDVDRRIYISQLESAAYAKAEGRKIMKCGLRSDWSDELKLSIMYTLNFQKYTTHPILRDKLIDTFPHEIVEGNTWKDVFGVCAKAKVRIN